MSGSVISQSKEADSCASVKSIRSEVRYLDSGKRVLTSAIAYWADKGADLLFDPPPWIADPSHSFVVRKLTMKIYARENLGEYVSVNTHFSRLGNTSFSAMYEIFNEDGSLLAHVWTLCVMCTVEDMKPMAIPDKHKLVVTSNLPQPESAMSSIVFPETKPIYTWKTTVRVTDCDLFGHVNNTKYPTMAEEALAFAVHAKAFDGDREAEALARAQTRYMHIEFLEQALPFTELEISIWFCKTKKAFLLKFECEDTLLTEVLVAAHESSNWKAKV